MFPTNEEPIELSGGKFIDVYPNGDYTIYEGNPTSANWGGNLVAFDSGTGPVNYQGIVRLQLNHHRTGHDNIPLETRARQAELEQQRLVHLQSRAVSQENRAQIQYLRLIQEENLPDQEERDQYPTTQLRLNNRHSRSTYPVLSLEQLARRQQQNLNRLLELIEEIISLKEEIEIIARNRGAYQYSPTQVATGIAMERFTSQYGPLSNVALRLTPILGTTIDIFEVITGREAFTNRELSRGERVLSGIFAGLSTLFGTVRVLNEGSQALQSTYSNMQNWISGIGGFARNHRLLKNILRRLHSNQLPSLGNLNLLKSFLLALKNIPIPIIGIEMGGIGMMPVNITSRFMYNIRRRINRLNVTGDIEGIERYIRRLLTSERNMRTGQRYATVRRVMTSDEVRDVLEAVFNFYRSPLGRKLSRDAETFKELMQLFVKTRHLGLSRLSTISRPAAGELMVLSHFLSDPTVRRVRLVPSGSALGRTPDLAILPHRGRMFRTEVRTIDSAFSRIEPNRSAEMISQAIEGKIERGQLTSMLQGMLSRIPNNGDLAIVLPSGNDIRALIDMAMRDFDFPSGLNNIHFFTGREIFTFSP